MEYEVKIPRSSEVFEHLYLRPKQIVQKSRMGFESIITGGRHIGEVWPNDEFSKEIIAYKSLIRIEPYYDWVWGDGKPSRVSGLAFFFSDHSEATLLKLKYG
jgi:hypothetical protein